MRFPSIRWLWVGMCVLLGACGQHEQETGEYAFTATEIVQDTCGLLPDGEALWDGHVLVTGQRVWVEYHLFDIRLIGEYQEVSDTFIADGTATGVTTEVQGRACGLDVVAVHMEGTSEGTSAFSGRMSVHYQSNRGVECLCDLVVRYHAVRIGD